MVFLEYSRISGSAMSGALISSRNLAHILLPRCHKCLSSLLISKRQLNLQEYQSKSLMREFKLNVQPFHVADSLKEAERVCKIFPCDEYVVKAMILAGGRGKGTFLENGFKGGVKLTTDKNEVLSLAEKMIGNHLVTHQTTSTGVKVKKVMIAESYRCVYFKFNYSTEIFQNVIL